MSRRSKRIMENRSGRQANIDRDATITESEDNHAGFVPWTGYEEIEKIVGGAFPMRATMMTLRGAFVAATHNSDVHVAKDLWQLCVNCLFSSSEILPFILQWTDGSDDIMRKESLEFFKKLFGDKVTPTMIDKYIQHRVLDPNMDKLVQRLCNGNEIRDQRLSQARKRAMKNQTERRKETKYNLKLILKDSVASLELDEFDEGNLEQHFTHFTESMLYMFGMGPDCQAMDNGVETPDLLQEILGECNEALKTQRAKAEKVANEQAARIAAEERANPSKKGRKRKRNLPARQQLTNEQVKPIVDKVKMRRAATYQRRQALLCRQQQEQHQVEQEGLGLATSSSARASNIHFRDVMPQIMSHGYDPRIKVLQYGEKSIIASAIGIAIPEVSDLLEQLGLPLDRLFLAGEKFRRSLGCDSGKFGDIGYKFCAKSNPMMSEEQRIWAEEHKQPFLVLSAYVTAWDNPYSTEVWDKWLIHRNSVRYCHYDAMSNVRVAIIRSEKKGKRIVPDRVPIVRWGAHAGVLATDATKREECKLDLDSACQMLVNMAVNVNQKKILGDETDDWRKELLQSNLLTTEGGRRLKEILKTNKLLGTTVPYGQLQQFYAMVLGKTKSGPIVPEYAPLPEVIMNNTLYSKVGTGKHGGVHGPHCDGDSNNCSDDVKKPEMIFVRSKNNKVRLHSRQEMGVLTTCYGASAILSHHSSSELCSKLKTGNRTIHGQWGLQFGFDHDSNRIAIDNYNVKKKYSPVENKNDKVEEFRGTDTSRCHVDPQFQDNLKLYVRSSIRCGFHPSVLPSSEPRNNKRGKHIFHVYKNKGVLGPCFGEENEGNIQTVECNNIPRWWWETDVEFKKFVDEEDAHHTLPNVPVVNSGTPTVSRLTLSDLSVVRSRRVTAFGQSTDGIRAPQKTIAFEYKTKAHVACDAKIVECFLKHGEIPRLVYDNTKDGGGVQGLELNDFRRLQPIHLDRKNGLPLCCGREYHASEFPIQFHKRSHKILNRSYLQVMEIHHPYKSPPKNIDTRIKFGRDYYLYLRSDEFHKANEKVEREWEERYDSLPPMYVGLTGGSGRDSGTYSFSSSTCTPADPHKKTGFHQSGDSDEAIGARCMYENQMPFTLLFNKSTFGGPK